MKPIESYISEIVSKYSTGEAREHAYRGAFEKLIRELMPELSQVINEPKRSAHGSPDFVFLKNSATVGYAEAKDIGVKLEKVEKSEQMERYFGYSNIILTNYLDFRFYKNGLRYGEEISIANIIGENIVPVPEAYEQLEFALVNALLTPGVIKSGKHLSKVMGIKARRIRDNVSIYLNNHDNEKNKDILKIFDAIKNLLIKDLSGERFADLYAQTLVYGLFLARYHDKTPESFSRNEARDLVPKTNPFLRDFFDHIAGNSFDERLARVVDELCETFQVADVRALLHEFYRSEDLWGNTKESPDPIIHFYEDFLREYDSKQRFELGVFYTPLPVVRFIVRSVDEVIKDFFALPGGLSDQAVIDKGSFKGMPKVQILDPAVGTGTFLNEVVRHIRKSFSGQEGRWKAFVNDSLLKRIHGFEIMMASYVIAHLKIGITFEETGYSDFNNRLGIYLTNSLEEAPNARPDLFSIGLQDSLSKEAIEAGNIKRDLPVMTVIGNPPYSGISLNKGEWISKLLLDYKKVDGVALNERKHWLNDDYVKFIRLAENFVERSNEGVVGMITNHGYLENPTFRGMRWHLLNTFDAIYVIDLHGNSKKRERAEDGSKDENVFDIQQGVAILIAVRSPKKKKGLGKVFRHDLRGSRKEKYDFLDRNSFRSVEWREVALEKPNFQFVTNTDSQLKPKYEKGFSLADLFIEKVSGIVSARDGMVIDINREALLNRVEMFTDLNLTDSEIRTRFFGNRKAGKYLPGDSRGWKIEDARKSIRGIDHDSYIHPINYRPFDRRWIYYHSKMVDWGREKLMANFIGRENVGLVFEKIIPAQDAAVSVYVTEDLIDAHLTGSQSYVAPLYIFDNEGTRSVNLERKITDNIRKIAGDISPEMILDYIYGVLHSPKYREEYSAYLRQDFPRIKYPANSNEFNEVSRIGGELRSLHLFKDDLGSKISTTYSVSGSNEVEKIRYEQDKVFINTNQYFGGVSTEVWNFSVGSHKPAQKWLKDRAGSILNDKDLTHYQKMISVIMCTINLMHEIDEAIYS